MTRSYNRVIIERQPPEGEASGTGCLYYALYLRYFKPVEEVTAMNRGIIVSRQYTLDACDEDEQACRAVDEAQVGDVIKVKLTIIAPNIIRKSTVGRPWRSLKLSKNTFAISSHGTNAAIFTQRLSGDKLCSNGILKRLKLLKLASNQTKPARMRKTLG